MEKKTALKEDLNLMIIEDYVFLETVKTEGDNLWKHWNDPMPTKYANWKLEVNLVSYKANWIERTQTVRESRRKELPGRNQFCKPKLFQSTLEFEIE